MTAKEKIDIVANVIVGYEAIKEEMQGIVFHRHEDFQEMWDAKMARVFDYNLSDLLIPKTIKVKCKMKYYKSTKPTKR
jgi:hypothetical protein